eukprot:scaffold115258_cov48-Phaeocystis_antarctica.AAC.1
MGNKVPPTDRPSKACPPAVPFLVRQSAVFLSTAAVWCVPFCLDCSVPSVSRVMPFASYSKPQLINPSGWGIDIVDAPLSGAWHVLWGPTGTPWGRAEGCNM